MLIAANTKISALIKANPASIDAIASINSHFEKLKNPVLRKILASRVTIADAARIGGCEVGRFFEILEPLGFQVNTDQKNALKPGINIDALEMPAKLAKLLPDNLTILDVRDAIASGNDPFRKIMQAIEIQENEKALLIINTFEPTPLVAILKKKGFNSFIEIKSTDLVYTYFWKAENSPKTPSVIEPEISNAIDDVLVRFAGKVKQIDVRHLEMPQPMITILQELEILPAGMALLVNHKRVPQYLLPQLEDRGYSIALKEVAPGAVNLLIYK